MRCFKDELNARVIRQYWFTELSRRLGLDIVESPVLQEQDDRIISRSRAWIEHAVTTYKVRGLISEMKFLCNASTVDLCLWHLKDNSIAIVYSAIVSTYNFARKLIGTEEQLTSTLEEAPESNIYEVAMKHKFIRSANDLVIYSDSSKLALKVGMIYEHGGYIDMYRLMSFFMNIEEESIFPLMDR